MATITGGYSCVNRPATFGGTMTVLILGAKITSSGKINSICIYNDGGSNVNVKCKIFRINGSNYDIIHTHGSWQTHNGAGAQSFTVDWDVLSDDMVGISFQSAYIDVSASGTGLFDNISGDVTTNTPISSWQLDSLYDRSRAISIYATGATDVLPIKINIGDAWKDIDAMKINIGDSWKDVVSVKQNIGDTWKTVF